MMEPAKNRMCNDVSEPLDRACAGRKTCVRTATIEPNEQGAVGPTQMQSAWCARCCRTLS